MATLDSNEQMTPSVPTQPAVSVLKKERGFAERIVLAGINLLFAHALVKLAGLLTNSIVPNCFGTEVSDVFIFVYATVLGQAFSIGEQCLSPALLPVFVRAKEKDGDARAWHYLSILFNLQALIVLGLVAVLILFPQPIISALTQWDATKVTLSTSTGKVRGELLGIDERVVTLSVEGQQRTWAHAELKSGFTAQEISKLQRDLAAKPPRRELSGSMLPYIAPGLLGMSLASVTYGVLIGYKRFFMAGFGDSLLKFCVLLGAIVGALLAPAGKPADWRFIVGGAVIGGTVKLLIHLLALGRQQLRMYRPSLNLRDPYVGAFILLVLPLLAGILVSGLRDVVINNVLTSQASLPTYYKQGKQIVDSLGFLVPFTLSIALLPYFCDLAARDDNRQLGQLLTRTIRLLIWVFVPVALVLGFAAYPICFILYEGKVITPAVLQYPALVMKFFAVQLPFAALEMMVMQAFFSNRRMLAPTLTGIVFSIVAAAFAYTLVIGFDIDDPYWVLVTIAACVVIPKVLKACVLVGLLKSTVPVLPLGETVAFLFRLLICGAAAGVAAWSATQLLAGPLRSVLQALPGGRLNYLAQAVGVAIAAGGVYLLLSLLLRLEEPRIFWQWTREKIKRRGSTAPAPEL